MGNVEKQEPRQGKSESENGGNGNEARMANDDEQKRDDKKNGDQTTNEARVGSKTTRRNDEKG